MGAIRRAALIGVRIGALVFCHAAGAAQFAYVANYWDNTVSVVDLGVDAVVANVPVAEAPRVLALDPAGARLFIGHDAALSGGSVSIMDTASEAIVANVNGLGRIDDIVANGTFAYVLNSNVTFGVHSVSVVDASTHAVVATIPAGLGGQIALDPAMPRLYVATGSALDVIDTTSNAVVGSVSLTSGNGAMSVAINPSGTRAYVGNRSGNSVWVVDTAANAVVATISVGLSPRRVAVSPAGTYVYVLNWSDSSVSVIDTASNAVTATLPVGPPSSTMAQTLIVNPAGDFLYAGSVSVTSNPNGTVTFADTVTAFDAATNAIVASRAYGAADNIAFAVKPDGSRLYVLDDRGVANAGALIATVAATSTSLTTIGVGHGPQAVVIGPVVPAQPPVLTADSIRVLVGAIGNSVNVAANDARLPGGAIFSIAANTCPGPASVDASGLVTHDVPTVIGASCTVSVQVCAPPPDSATCSSELLTVMAAGADPPTPVPALSVPALLAMAALLVAAGAYGSRHRGGA